MAELGDYLEQVSDYTAPARKGVQESGEAYTSMLKEGASLPDKLKTAVQEKLDYNKDLIEQQSQAAGQYFSAPAEAREMYQDVWDPFQREKLVSQYRAQQLEPYSALTSILGQRMGNVSDIIGAGVQGWQGLVDAAQAATGLAQQQYGNVMNQYGMGADMYQQAQSRTLQRAQMENQMKAEQARLALQKMLGLRGLEMEEKQLGLQQEKLDWEKPWQEKLWQYELDRPYYKDTGSGGGGSWGGGGLGWSTGDETTDEVDYDAIAEESGLSDEELSTGQSKAQPWEYGPFAQPNPYVTEGGQSVYEGEGVNWID